MSNEKINLNQFITAEMITSFAGCTAIVCGLVQILKMYVPLPPLWINLFASLFVVCIRIIFKDCQSWKEILLGLLQIIPILLGSSGTYEVIKHLI